MRISSVAWLIASVALMSASCNSTTQDLSEPAASATSTPPVAAATANPDSPANSDSTDQTSSAPSTDVAKTPETAQADSSSTAAGNNEPVPELIAGISSPVIVRQFASVQKQSQENPTDWKAQVSFVTLLQLVGQERIRARETDKAYATFAAAGDVVRTFLETKSDFPESAHRVFSDALYNDACAASLDDNQKRALESLDAAIQWGFSNFDLMEKDEDLVSLRSTPDFNQKLTGWKAAAREKALQHAKAELAAGESFPFDFSLTDVDGKPIKLADYQGKVLIVDIWGTWCPPCRAEIPSFIRLQNEFGAKGFQMIGLNKENKTGADGNELVKSFMAKEKMNYPCALIDAATQDQVPSFQGYPTTLFIDRAGKVRLKVVGLHDYEFLEAVVQTLLDEPKPELVEKT